MNPHEEVDATLREHLHAWERQLGAPTCREGCFRCCRGLITVHSGEAPAILRSVQAQGPAVLARRRANWQQQNDALRAGSWNGLEQWCPLLEDGRCSVYSGRPVVCRTQTVWHDAKYCGATGVDACTPAEFIGARSIGLIRLGLAEVEAGRWPFWGALSLVLELCLKYSREINAGENVAGDRAESDLESGLLQTPPASNLDAARGWLQGKLEAHQKKLRDTAWPYGQPRGAKAKNREALAPHFLGGAATEPW